MKYSLEGYNENEVIKNYEVKDNKIIVNYLNGETLIFNTDELKDLIEVMNVQSSDFCKDYISKKFKVIVKALGGMTATYLTAVAGMYVSAYYLSKAKNIPELVAITALTGGLEFLFIYGMKKYGDYYVNTPEFTEMMNKLDEMEKHKFIQDNKEILKEYINDVDNLSISNLEDIKNNSSFIESNIKEYQKVKRAK